MMQHEKECSNTSLRKTMPVDDLRQFVDRRNSNIFHRVCSRVDAVDTPVGPMKTAVDTMDLLSRVLAQNEIVAHEVPTEEIEPEVPYSRLLKDPISRMRPSTASSVCTKTEPYIVNCLWQAADWHSRGEFAVHKQENKTLYQIQARKKEMEKRAKDEQKSVVMTDGERISRLSKLKVFRGVAKSDNGFMSLLYASTHLMGLKALAENRYAELHAQISLATWSEIAKKEEMTLNGGHECWELLYAALKSNPLEKCAKLSIAPTILISRYGIRLIEPEVNVDLSHVVRIEISELDSLGSVRMRTQQWISNSQADVPIFLVKKQQKSRSTAVELIFSATQGSIAFRNLHPKQRDGHRAILQKFVCCEEIPQLRKASLIRCIWTKADGTKHWLVTNRRPYYDTSKSWDAQHRFTVPLNEDVNAANFCSIVPLPIGMYEHARIQFDILLRLTSSLVATFGHVTGFVADFIPTTEDSCVLIQMPAMLHVPVMVAKTTFKTT